MPGIDSSPGSGGVGHDGRQGGASITRPGHDRQGGGTMGHSAPATGRKAGSGRGLAAAVSPGQERWARILTWLYAVATLTAALLWCAGLAGLTTRLPVVVFGALNIPLTPSLVSVVILGLVTGALLRRR